MRRLALEGPERETFLRELLAAIEVRQRLGVLNDPEAAPTTWLRKLRVARYGPSSRRWQASLSEASA